MVGEIVAGAVQGAAQGVAQAAGEVVRAPVVAVASAGVVAASIPQAVSAVAEVTSSVAQGLEAVKSIAQPLGKVANGAKDSTFFASKLSAIAQTGDHHRALTMLAFGDMTSQMREVTSRLPDNILQRDFINLEKRGPQVVQGLTEEVARLQIGKDLVDNPEFLQRFTEEFGKDVAAQKILMREGKLTAEEYLANRQSMLERSANKASGPTKEKKDTDINEKELERLKREAALKAIQQHMQRWRLSVRVDKRLNPDAKQYALQRIDLFEQKVLIKEAMKWDGVSVMQLIALATVWMAEMST